MGAVTGRVGALPVRACRSVPDLTSDSTPGSAQVDRHELLADLADEFLRRHRAGEGPSLDEYCAKHAGLAGRIRDLFPAMLAMEQPGLGPPADVEPPAERVGATVGRYKPPRAEKGDSRSGSLTPFLRPRREKEQAEYRG